MLILTRGVGESIRLGEEIEIQIRAIEGNKVTMAILSDLIESLKNLHQPHGAKEGRLFRAANESRI
ncbi:carbon storage regulator [Legionella donaldsonii]|uniref:Carbon storage regulator n=1 Tax=Legionella donaldsonii TaxID=45060 RepID=A0A378J068_9GAMM|nr:carbon storage regulator [Legionella donaldsonii]STX41102.1 carbon storage regulator [Legionella donaldsonii]